MKAAGDRIGSHFDSNMGRVMHLFALHGILEKVVPEGREDVPPRGHRPDLLRASVVLLHATLEDLVRSIAEWKMPHAAPKAFERVQIAFPGSDKAKERMTLGELANFRGRSIDSVIVESVNLHLETATYNNLGDIIRLLDDLDIEVRIPGPLKSQVSAMIIRRHLIAHRVDRDRPDQDGARIERSIEAPLVYGWADAVRRLGKLIIDAT